MASDYLLEIDGIKGESQDSKYKESIEIHSYSGGASNSGSASQGTGLGSGVVSFQDLHFTADTTKSSPNLLLYCAKGTHIPKVVFHVRKQGTDQQEYITYTLEECMISSYSQAGSEGSGAVSEQFSINFTKIKYEYKPQKQDGSLGSAIEMTWNVKTRAPK